MRRRYWPLAILVGIALLVPVGALTAIIKGVFFADNLKVGETELSLKGTAVLKWARLFDVYAGALYLPTDPPGTGWREDLPKRLELAYFREIAAEDFVNSSDQLLRRNLSTEHYRSLAARLKELYGLFRDVQPGDRYALTYRPGSGTVLSLNDQPLGKVSGHDFALAYFGLWLGENPLSEGFRNRLLEGG